jgi:hypothetical protein
MPRGGSLGGVSERCRCARCKGLWRAVKRALSCLFEFVSGEWMFRCGHPNGGTIIFLRSVWVSAIIYALALWLDSGADWAWGIDCRRLQREITLHVPWLGAIFGAVYVALYARFASQWGYLAGLFNQIRQMLATWKPSDGNADHLFLWQAGFIEDALDLHLATKPMFATFIGRLLDDKYKDDGSTSLGPGPVALLLDDPKITVDGRKRRLWLHKQLNKRFDIPIPPSVLDETQ